GRPADASSDRTGTTMGGAAGAGMGGAAGAGMGGAAGARTGGAGGVRDGSTQDGDGNALVDVASDSSRGGGGAGGGADASDGSVVDRRDGAPEGATTDAPPDVSMGTEAGADAISEDAKSGDEPQCHGANDCPVPSNACLYATCEDGGCGTAPVTLGTPVSVQVPGALQRHGE